MEKEVTSYEAVNLPEKRFRTGVINATVWKNQGRTETGEATEFRSVSFERRYIDKEGNWKSTSCLRISDLPKASLVLQKAYEYLALREQEPTVKMAA